MSKFHTWAVSLDEMYTIAWDRKVIAVVIATYAAQLKSMVWCDSCNFAWDNMTRVARNVVFCYNMCLPYVL